MNTRKIKRAFWVLAALPVLFFASCSEDDLGGDQGTSGNENGGDIRFEISIAPGQGVAVANGELKTRTATDDQFNTVWENGDQIGIFACTAGQNLSANASDNHIHNVKLTYSSAGSGTWTSSEALWWPGSGGKLDFYAYYPYDANATNPTAIAFNVLADQSGTTNSKSNYSLSDLLTAKTADKNKGDGVVSLTFNHAFAMVQVSLDNQLGAIDPNEEVIVTLRDVKAKAGLSLGAVTDTSGSGVTLVASDNDATTIKMYRVEQPADADYRSSFTFRAVVPAQSLAKDVNIFLVANGDLLLRGSALTANITMKGGQAEMFTQKLPTYIHRVRIKAGTFQMGDNIGNSNEQPVHSVILTQDFYMSKYQVTKAQYTAFLNATRVGENRTMVDTISMEERVLFTESQYDWTPRWNADTQKWDVTKAGDEQHPGDVPMIYVTWYGAKAYADWVGGSLPTEAQWEYACRAGTATAYSFGADDTDIDKYAWYSGNNSGGPGLVGTKLPNPWGLYDMHGNVWEWCGDWYGAYGNGPDTDPTGPTAGDARVLRGGGWIDNAQYCRSAYRDRSNPGLALYDYGFRVVFVP